MNPQAPTPQTWTQCPKCSSILEVHASALEQADGWVQCAKCSQTFLALSSEVRIDPLAQHTQASSLQPNSPASHQAPKDAQSHSRTLNDKAHEQHFNYDGSELKPQLSEPFLGTHDLDARFLKEDPLLASMTTSFAIKPQLISFEGESSSSTDPFGVPHSNGSRLGTLMGIGVAVLGLLGLLSILTYQNRNILASWAPELKVPLMQACQVLSCQIDWPVDLSALSIEMSAFEHDANDTNLYTLSLKLKNANSYTVAAPRVRLVLMNDKDQTLLAQSLELSKASEPRVVHPGTLNQWIIPINLSELTNQTPNGYRLELENP